MSLRRVLIAAAALLAAVYLRLLMPSYAARLFETLRDMTAEEQLVLRLPERAASWLIWN